MGERVRALLTLADVFDPVLYRLMTFPLITVAAINGHGK
jgi:enoyl-CoA hydratase/carnithine racemase